MAAGLKWERGHVVRPGCVGFPAIRLFHDPFPKAARLNPHSFVKLCPANRPAKDGIPEAIFLIAITREAEEEQRREMHRRIARYEDSGQGTCYLRNPEIARLILEDMDESAGEPVSRPDWQQLLGS